jgi:uncharacterized protein (DUF2342 family)
MDAKLRQYTDGAAFVRQVVDSAGWSGLNAVWAGPESLPSRTELHDPQAWLERVR